MGILTKLRQKTDSQKRMYSFFSALILTIIIFIVWLSFNSGLPKNQTIAENEETKLSSLSPWQVIQEEFSKIFNNDNNIDLSTSTFEVASSTVISEEITATSTDSATTTIN